MQLDSSVKEELSKWIVPSLTSSVTILPNHFTAFKGPAGSFGVLRRQATYDAAIGARAMHALQNYRRAPICDNKTYTFAVTYGDGVLSFYVCYPVHSAGDGAQLDYYMHRLNRFLMNNRVESYIEGLTWYRNSMDCLSWSRWERIRRLVYTT